MLTKLRKTVNNRLAFREPKTEVSSESKITGLLAPRKAPPKKSTQSYEPLSVAEDYVRELRRIKEGFNK